MRPETITPTLAAFFPGATVQTPTPTSWQIEIPPFRLLVILSEDGSWLRMLVPIAPLQEAFPYFEQLLAANFDSTQAVRYALNQGALWGVFHHALGSLTLADFQDAIAQLVSLQKRGLSDCLNQLLESKIRQIVEAAKLQGQTLQATLQNIERFYAEGMLGNLEQSTQEQQQFIAAWRAQLERLWHDIDVEGNPKQ